jgi:DNA-binding Lrp family transcriptional regulator
MIYAWLKKLKADQDVERYKVNPNYTKLGSKLWQRSLKRWEIIYWICFLTVHIAVPYQLYEVGNQTYEIVSTEQTEINGVEVYKVTLKDKILDVNIINYELVKDKEEQ